MLSKTYNTFPSSIGKFYQCFSHKNVFQLPTLLGILLDAVEGDSYIKFLISEDRVYLQKTNR